MAAKAIRIQKLKEEVRELEGPMPLQEEKEPTVVTGVEHGAAPSDGTVYQQARAAGLDANIEISRQISRPEVVEAHGRAEDQRELDQARKDRS
ncbi:hypothetical protein M0802_012912 [Mischocyttarus mexicanus]|nr:hypothetical protein M0802_012912 [Mischocyttarus mexicanus]